MVSYYFCSFLLLSQLITQSVSLSIIPNSTRTDGLHSPTTLHSTTPLLSWLTTSTTRGDNQTAYQIQVSTDRSIVSPDLWDSGKVSSANNSVSYAGTALSSRTQAFWRVRVWDINSVPSDWDSISTFELGLLDPSDWTASWIANEQYRSGKNSLPTFAKEFSVACSGSVQKARLYIVGLGIYYVEINGLSISEEVLPPGDSTWNQTLWYAGIDVTEKLQSGENVIGVELGKGQYDAEEPLGNPERYSKWYQDPQQLKLIAQLEYSCDGEHTVVVNSDSSWLTTTEGPYIESSWYGGEEYDARKILTNYSTASGNRSGWLNANISGSPGGKLLGAMREPMVIVDSFPAKSVTNVRLPALIISIY